MPIAVLENRAYQYKLHIPQLDLWFVIDIAHVLRLRWSHEIDATQKTEQCVNCAYVGWIVTTYCAELIPVQFLPLAIHVS